MAGIYIHIPFCKSRCIYCDFYSTTQFEKHAEGFIEAAMREMEREKGFLSGRPVSTLYFGGGTPSLYSPEDIGRLTGAVDRNFDTGQLLETTLEANPEDLTAEYLRGIAAAGIDRLSLGIQSFDDRLLTFMRRRHDAARAVSAVRSAREAGFGNISIDLIYGIPGMSEDGWMNNLSRAVELGPEHISAYHLTFEPGTALDILRNSGEVAEVPDESGARQFDTLHRVLTRAGYEHYEVSNFALPGYRSRHNSSYWTGEPYLGIGPGAHSFKGNMRRWCSMKVGDYATSDRPVYGSEELTPSDRYNELVMTSLRTADGLSQQSIDERCGHKFSEYFIRAVSELTARGLLQREGDRFYIPTEKFFTSDNVISALFI